MILNTILGGAAVAAVAGAGLWVRRAPVEAARWHVDPITADRPGRRGWLVRPEGGDAAAARSQLSPEELLGRLNAVARATPRTRLLAGSMTEGRLTYETRSRICRFPDYTTVTTVPDGDGARPALLARARFGRSDMGVNRKRVEGWLAQLPGV